MSDEAVARRAARLASYVAEALPELAQTPWSAEATAVCSPNASASSGPAVVDLVAPPGRRSMPQPLEDSQAGRRVKPRLPTPIMIDASSEEEEVAAPSCKRRRPWMPCPRVGAIPEASANGHTLMLAGPMVWCRTCGAYQESTGMGALFNATRCPVQPRSRWAARRRDRLNTGWHPKREEVLAPATRLRIDHAAAAWMGFVCG